MSVTFTLDPQGLIKSFISIATPLFLWNQMVPCFKRRPEWEILGSSGFRCLLIYLWSGRIPALLTGFRSAVSVDRVSPSFLSCRETGRSFPGFF